METLQKTKFNNSIQSLKGYKRIPTQSEMGGGLMDYKIIMNIDKGIRIFFK